VRQCFDENHPLKSSGKWNNWMPNKPRLLFYCQYNIICHARGYGGQSYGSQGYGGQSLE
jgi:hypothetical protein